MKGLKKKGIWLIIAASAFGAPVASYAIAPHGVKYTPHNLSTTNRMGAINNKDSANDPEHGDWVTGGQFKTSGSETEVCIFCHTPHNAVTDPQNFLWNRIGTTSNFQLYTVSPTLDFTTPPGMQLSAMSRMCMTCHDGVTAMNSMANPRPSASFDPVYNQLGDLYWSDNSSDPPTYSSACPDTGWCVNIGEGWVTFPMTTDDSFDPATGGILTNDHPVSFDYQSAITNGDNTLKPTDIGGNSVGGLPLWPDGASKKVECMTCHDPHINYNPRLPAPQDNTRMAYVPFLRKSNASSSLCFTCHDK